MNPWDPPEPARLGASRRSTPAREATRREDLPLFAVADGLEAPVPVALRLRQAGLLDEGSAVQVLSATPPPVRDREAPNRPAVSLTPPPSRRRPDGPRPALQYGAPVLEDAE